MFKMTPHKTKLVLLSKDCFLKDSSVSCLEEYVPWNQKKIECNFDLVTYGIFPSLASASSK